MEDARRMPASVRKASLSAREAGRVIFPAVQSRANEGVGGMAEPEKWREVWGFD
jgi:hypothetical protein